MESQHSLEYGDIVEVSDIVGKWKRRIFVQKLPDKSKKSVVCVSKGSEAEFRCHQKYSVVLWTNFRVIHKPKVHLTIGDRTIFLSDESIQSIRGVYSGQTI